MKMVAKGMRVKLYQSSKPACRGLGEGVGCPSPEGGLRHGLKGPSVEAWGCRGLVCRG